MTRQNATNFGGVLQFPYADAATDLFKKEDVQILAKAVDLHDHTSGKGLVLPASAIPLITSAMIQDGAISAADIGDGQITTAKIQDGTIQSGDLAPSSIVQLQTVSFDGSTYARTTPINSAQAVPGIGSISMTLFGGVCLFLGQAIWQESQQGATVSFGVGVDGSFSNLIQMATPQANMWFESHFHWYSNISAGAHTFALGWDMSNGSTTLTRGPWYGEFTVIEFKR